MITDDLREALAAAHVEREHARAALAEANTAARRAGELVSKLEAELTAVRDTGMAATVRRSHELAKWAASPDAPLPNGHEGRLVDSISENRCAGELNASLAAHADLLGAANAAQETLRASERRVIAISARIIAAEAETLSAALMLHRRAAWEIEDRLEGLTRVWLPAAPGASPSPIAVPNAVYAALQTDRDQLQGGITPPIPWNSTLWSEYLMRLADDPDAVYEHRDPEPAPIPLHAQPRVAFRAQGDLEAERLAAKQAAEAEERANQPVPGHVQSLIDLAIGRGEMHQTR